MDSACLAGLLLRLHQDGRARAMPLGYITDDSTCGVSAICRRWKFSCSARQHRSIGGNAASRGESLRLVSDRSRGELVVASPRGKIEIKERSRYQ